MQGYSQVSTNGMKALTVALSKGVCPRLRRLDLSKHGYSGGTTGELLANMLKAGNCRALAELKLYRTHLGTKGMATLGKVLETGVCPELRILVSTCYPSP